jgi:hypothetical protein
MQSWFDYSMMLVCFSKSRQRPSLRLREGADIYQIAKSCRTGVEMIEKYYSSHLKNTLDAAAINVRKSKVKSIRRD